MKEFFKQHFDKFLLSALFLISLGSFIHFARELSFYSTPQNTERLSDMVNWLENIIGQILAALLTLMVGRSIAATATATPGSGSVATIGTSSEPSATATEGESK